MELKSDKPRKLRRHLTIWLSLLLLFASGMLLIQWQVDGSAFTYVSFIGNFEKVNSSDLIAAQTNRTVLILMWTKWFSRLVEEGVLHECLQENCLLTNNRSMVNESDAVVFHIRDLNWKDLPNQKLQNQHYVFFNWESPYHTGGDFSTDWQKSYFDLTMTYRRDSDIYAPYGSIVKRQSPLRLDLLKLIENKTKPIAWMVSNCHTPGGREILVSKLQKYFSVDVYGSCGSQTCQKDVSELTYDPSSCGHIIEQNYKFYLAFENSLCKDYVTEKFFLRLRRYVVPVVLERKNYELFCAEYKKPWFIAVDDFGSVDDLVAHLQYLHQNASAYYEYLRWHEQYESIVHLNSDTGVVTRNHWCDLCRMARLNRKVAARNVFNWWHNDACHTRKY